MTEASWRAAVDFDRLAQWMDGQRLEAGPLEHPQALTGGTQNILLRFRRGPREFVLRRPPLLARLDGNKTILREARLLAALAGTAVPHARLIAACDDSAVLGAPFYLMEPVDGFNASGTPLPALHAADPAIRARMGLAMVEALLCLHAVDHQAIGLADFGRPQGFLQRQVPRWRAQLESYSAYAAYHQGPGAAGLPGASAVGDWLEAHGPAHFTPGLLHGDFHLANVMFRRDGPELAALIDWELATIGDPLLDLGWLVATWPDASGQGAGTIQVAPAEGFVTTEQLIDHYRAGSPRDLSAIDWYVVLACFKLAILLEGSYARTFSQTAADDAATALGQRHHASALRLLTQAAGHISKYKETL